MRIVASKCLALLCWFVQRLLMCSFVQHARRWRQSSFCFKWTKVTYWRNILFKNVFFDSFSSIVHFETLELEWYGHQYSMVRPQRGWTILGGDLCVGESFVYIWDRVYGVPYGGSFVFHMFSKPTTMYVVGIKPPTGNSPRFSLFHDGNLCHMMYQSLLAMFKVSPLICIFFHTTMVWR